MITADNIVLKKKRIKLFFFKNNLILSVTIDASVLFRIMNPRLAIYAVEDYIAATRLIKIILKLF